jgi:hypothetical protein
MAFFVVCLLFFGRLCPACCWQGYSLTGSAGLSFDVVSVTTVSLTLAASATSDAFAGASSLVTVSFTTVSLTTVAQSSAEAVTAPTEINATVVNDTVVKDTVTKEDAPAKASLVALAANVNDTVVTDTTSKDKPAEPVKE